MVFQPSHRKATGIVSSRGLRSGRRRRCVAASLRAERLEDRTLLASIVWAGGNGDWSAPSNWIGGKVPEKGDYGLDQ